MCDVCVPPVDDGRDLVALDQQVSRVVIPVSENGSTASVAGTRYREPAGEWPREDVRGSRLREPEPPVHTDESADLLERERVVEFAQACPRTLEERPVLFDLGGRNVPLDELVEPPADAVRDQRAGGEHGRHGEIRPFADESDHLWLDDLAGPDVRTAELADRPRRLPVHPEDVRIGDGTLPWNGAVLDSGVERGVDDGRHGVGNVAHATRFVPGHPITTPFDLLSWLERVGFRLATAVTTRVIRGEPAISTSGREHLMVDVVTLSLFVSAVLASLFMAWTIGAGSAGSTPFAPAVGANAISVMRAGFVVGLCIFLGAVLQGTNVSEAVGRELVAGVELSTTAAAMALVIAASLVTVGIFTGYPIATAFTVTGAVIGVGLAMGGDPNWPKYLEIAALWTLTPVVGSAVAYVIARWIRDGSAGEVTAVSLLGALVGLVLANIEFAVLGSDGGATVAGAVASVTPGPSAVTWLLTSAAFAVCGGLLVARQLSLDVVRGERRFALAMGAVVAFSAGGSQVGLAVGPLVPLLEGIVPLLAVLVGGGLGLLVGAWTGAPRLIKAVSQDYASLGPRRALAALIPSFAIAQVAILFGIPVSFNQIVVSAVAGSGAAAGVGAGISRRKIGYTFGAWAASFVGALAVGYGGFVAVTGL